MVSNSEIEMRWIDAWSDLIEMVGQRRNVPCQLPDFSLVDVETCKEWIQDAVYQGDLVHVEQGWIQGKRGVVVSRSRPDEE